MTQESRLRAALEKVGMLPCSCSRTGTCPVCIAVQALMPEQVNVVDDQTVRIILPGHENELSTIIQLARNDSQFPLITEDPAVAIQETLLRALAILVDTVKELPSFKEACTGAGLRVDVVRQNV